MHRFLTYAYDSLSSTSIQSPVQCSCQTDYSSSAATRTPTATCADGWYSAATLTGNLALNYAWQGWLCRFAAVNAHLLPPMLPRKTCGSWLQSGPFHFTKSQRNRFKFLKLRITYWYLIWAEEIVHKVHHILQLWIYLFEIYRKWEHGLKIIWGWLTLVKVILLGVTWLLLSTSRVKLYLLFIQTTFVITHLVEELR